MAFDEEFHLGLIRLYAEQLTPFGLPTSSNLAAYGIAGADPSYLFHFFMSFPYRLFTFAGFNEQAIVIGLRLINIVLVVAALFVYREAMIRFGISKIVSHTTLALLILVPVLVVIAGQINYDNVVLLIVAGCAYYAADIIRTIHRDHILPVRSLLMFVTIALIGTATKYAFIPILVGIVLFILAGLFTHRKRIAIVRSVVTQVKTWSLPIVLLVVAGAITLTVINIRYVTNIATYGTPLPACDDVFDEVACQQYGPWNRDKILIENKDVNFNALSYPEYIYKEFLPGLSMRLTFAVAGPTNDYQTKMPLVLLERTFIALSVISGVFILFAATTKRRFRHEPLLMFTLLVTVCYVVPLSWTLYGSYVATGQPVAINGRYLLPILPFIGALMITAVRHSVPRSAYAPLTYYLPVVALLLVLFGGGVGTYVYLAESHWFWSGWGQSSHSILKSITDMFLIRLSQ